MRALLIFAALSLGKSAPAQKPADSSRGTQPVVAAPAAQDTAKLSQEIAQRRAAGENYLPGADHFTWTSGQCAR